MLEIKKSNQIIQIPIGWILWKNKILIIFGPILLTVLSLVIMSFIPYTYRDQAILNFTGVQQGAEDSNDQQIQPYQGLPTHRYVEYSNLFKDTSMFQAFLKKSKKHGDVKLKIMHDLKEYRQQFCLHFKPLPTWKEYFQESKILIKRTSVKNILGVRFEIDHRKQLNGQTLVNIVSDYIKYCVLFQEIKQYTKRQVHELNSSIREKLNSLANKKVDLQLLKDKMKRLKIIIKRYPKASLSLNRELVSVVNKGYRYLPPTIQLVGIESNILDIEEANGRLKHEIDLLSGKLSFYNKLLAVFKTQGFGFDIWMELKDILEKLKKNSSGDMGLDVSVFNDIRTRVEWYRLMHDQMKLFHDTKLKTKIIKPNRSLIAVGVGVLSFLLLLFIVVFKNWLQYHQSYIASESDTKD